MQEYADEILSELQGILNKRRGFVAFSQVLSYLSKDLRDKLYIKSNTTPRVVKQKILPVVEENFIIHKKGVAEYIMLPREPEEFVFAWLSEDKPVALNELVRLLKPFRKQEVLAMMTDLVNAGRVRVQFEDSYKVSLFACGAGHEAVSESRQAPKVQAFRPENYTLAKFRKAYDELHTFREFVRICDLRRKLDWPREAFDGMIRALRDNRTIRVIRADESMLTQDEIQDCFIDENNIRMGLITWNGR